MFRHAPLPNNDKFDFQESEIPRMFFFAKLAWELIVRFEVLLQSQRQKQGFLGVGDISNNPTIMKIHVFGTLIRQNWIGRMPREDLHFGKPIQNIFNQNDPKNANMFSL